uniref:Uncharacterized protein n=1 Tax=Pithovirus LCPAC101 TaxID=2506586 RepID=A0A481Z235_9VIRU|nr:MAG: hypothetical protein LCPAC101_00650 [Pithovirus LCPAC101]
MNITCPDGYSAYSEFGVHDTCSVRIEVDKILKISSLFSSVIIFFFHIKIYYLFSERIKNMKSFPMIILFLSIVNNILLSLYLIQALMTDNKSFNSLVSALTMHLGVSTMVMEIILFIHFIFNFILKDWNFKKIKYIFYIANPTQIAVFYIGIFSSSADERMTKYYNIIFWCPVCIFFILSIPIFYIIYKNLYYNMENDDIKSEKYILFIIILFISSIFIILISILCMFKANIDWVLFDTFWLFMIYLNLFIFLLLTQEKNNNNAELDNIQPDIIIDETHQPPPDINY